MFSLVKSRKSKVESQGPTPSTQHPAPKTQRLSLITLIIGFCFLLFQFSAQAQCAMCRAVLESEENGGTKAKAINDGIVYLMAFPYLLVGILGYIIYRYVKKKSELENLK